MIAHQDATPRRLQSQLLLAWVYNKLILFHLLPQLQATTVQVYELDPNFSYRNIGHIRLSESNDLF
jgi:hypothetical protein